MRFRLVPAALLLLACAPAFAQSGPGGEPLSIIKERLGHALDIIADSSLQNPESLPELRRRLVDELAPIFTFQEMTLRALGAHARALNAKQVSDLSVEFQKLLERVYIDRLTANLINPDNPYKVDGVRYLGQETRGAYARINTIASISKNSDTADLAINYRMVNRGKSWFIYDVEIEGISLIDNYRSQFHTVLTNYNFDHLLASLRKKAETMSDTAAMKFTELTETDVAGAPGRPDGGQGKK